MQVVCCKPQKYALKKVKLQDSEKKDKLLAEVKLLEELRHPNIVKLVDFKIEADELSLLLEFANDGDLAQQITKMRQQKIRFSEKMVYKW